MARIDAALALAAQGFKVFPIATGKKAPPLLNGWPQKATSNADEVRDFWLAVPDANIGVHCVGLCVIDVDYAKGGDDSLAKLELVYDLPKTLTARTPTGGRHLYFALPEGHPGVTNSVGSLGSGLDIRSTGGYVVAPGSETAAGSYTWEDPSISITPVPEWLVLKLGTIVPKTSTPAPAKVADAPDGVAEAAAAWLHAQPPAVEGQGGDAHTFAVACGLRDRGVSEAQALSLLAVWNEKCSPPWEPDLLGVKVANAYRYAQNEPASRVALPSDFPFLLKKDDKICNKRPAALPLSQFANLEHRGHGYVVKGLLQRRSYASIYGAPGEGKTFVALDLAYHVAAGADWMERKVHAGPVLYLAFEGTGGLVKRAQALRQKYGTADTPLYIAGAAFNLRELAGRAALGEIIASLPAKPVLIVVDTFARALSGGDENSAQDVGAFNSAVAALIESTGACVAIIHHSGKDPSKGARGSSALLGALDTEIEIRDGAATARKQRDIELGDSVGFKLAPVVVGIDADGDESTSCVVEPSDVKTGPSGRIAGNTKRGFDALCEISPTNSPVSQMKWRAACEEFLGTKGAAQRFYDIKKSLLAKGFIVLDNEGRVTRRLE